MNLAADLNITVGSASGNILGTFKASAKSHDATGADVKTATYTMDASGLKYDNGAIDGDGVTTGSFNVSTTKNVQGAAKSAAQLASTKNNILIQSAQANQVPQGVLQLLQ